jgi:hypothetical protein
VSGIQRALDRRSAERDRARAFTGAPYIHEGSTEVVVPGTGVGELDLDIKFPIRFSELPHPTSSWVLSEGERLVAGAYPEVSCGFAELDYRELPGRTRVYFGGRLAVVVRAHPGCRLVVTYRISGKALASPEGTAR